MLKDLIHKYMNNPLFMSRHHIKSYQNKSSSNYYFGFGFGQNLKVLANTKNYPKRVLQNHFLLYSDQKTNFRNVTKISSCGIKQLGISLGSTILQVKVFAQSPFETTNSFGLGRLFYKSSCQLQNLGHHGNQNVRNLEGCSIYLKM